MGEAGGCGKRRPGRVAARTSVRVGAEGAPGGGCGVVRVTVTEGRLCLPRLTGVKDRQSWTLVKVGRMDFNQ